VTGPALAGLTVLVTRPELQAAGLCARVRAAGGEALPWPAIRIAPLEVPPGATDQPVPDWALFVSANAVRHGLGGLPPGPRIAAIGPATAAALLAAGRPADFTAAKADSEGLLADPAFADVAGRRILIVRGVGGRELLARSLRARGADVGYREVYRRERPSPPAAEQADLLDRWRRGGVDVYTATSIEILNNLHDMLGPHGRDLLAATSLVTASARVVQQAERRGHRGARLLASRPDNDALVDAITHWRSGRCASGGSGGAAS
jgi:uroporphyrinogen-III synthase